MRFAGSMERLSRLGDLSKEMREANRARDVATQQALNAGHQALEIKQLSREVAAAYGPTLQYMKGMDPYA